MPEIRRSIRNKTRTVSYDELSDPEEDYSDDSQTIQNVTKDDNIVLNKKTHKKSRGTIDAETSELEDIFQSSSNDEDNEDSNDEDYSEAKTKSTNKRRRQKTNTKNKNKVKPKTVKRRKQNTSLNLSKEQEEQYLTDLNEIESGELFNILANSDDISIDDYLRDWLETYNDDRDKFIADFINFLLDCCGSLTRLEPHDVRNNDSSNETIAEVQILFQNQKVHQFNLMVSQNNKKNSPFKPLYKNFVEFMTKLLDIANDLQLLYTEPNKENEVDENDIVMGPFLLDLLTWLSSFSVAKIRCFRYVSTLTLYLFQDFLSKHAVDLEKNYLAKYTKQLNLEESKKRQNSTTIEKLKKNVEEVQNNKIIIEHVLDNIIKLCFVHRFKDVDELIRSESMLHLSIWIKNYPEYFMKVTYLKYFGWLLSDNSNIVRSQVLKIMPDIMASNKMKKIDNSAIRQFFERFKQRILEIALNDIDLEVKLHAVTVLTEVASLGYLEDLEILMISSLLFDDNEIKVSSHGKTSRFLTAVAKFLTRITNETCKNFEKNLENIDDDISPLDNSAIVKIGIAIKFINNSFLYYLQDNKEIDSNKKLQILFQAAEFLAPYFSDQIENICQLLSNDNEFQKIFEILEDLEKEDDNMNDDEDEENLIDDETFNQYPLLPTNNENIVLYLTVLSGLCRGSVLLKNQQKLLVVNGILPRFNNLVKNLSLQSINILKPIVHIFNLFDTEDWIQANCEKFLIDIVKIFHKTFKETIINLSDDVDSSYVIYSNLIDHIKTFNKHDLDELWLNELSYIKLQLEKFLIENEDKQFDNIEQFNEHINTIFSIYVNKLAILGRDYMVETTDELLIKLFKQFYNVIPNRVHDLNDEMLEEVNFRLPVLLATWKLYKWADIMKKSPDSIISNDDYDITGSIQAIKYIKTIFDQLSQTLIELKIQESRNKKENKFFAIILSLSNCVIDIIVALKCFELQLPDNEEMWKSNISEQFPKVLPTDLTNVIMYTFLELENFTAKDLGVTLERLNDDDIVLSSNNTQIEDSEKKLLMYTIKLKTLIKLTLIEDDRITSRLALNKDCFDSLFNKIIDDSIFEDGENKSNNNDTDIDVVNKIADKNDSNPELNKENLASMSNKDSNSTLHSSQELNKTHATIRTSDSLDIIEEDFEEHRVPSPIIEQDSEI